ncbi:LytTR family transcriptional regulator DNA-binding domain-containing protein [Mucilaginibacter sp. SMC90]|uniref:LytTR family DNA-binding domain-containing protein n=1 Tax=Mucilaginibacter sp. SMC90 TaxID=2929803 RepID=UPI001FB32441|nr:LytTR family DNA-binding domain-containing protein [Mucilaginibacter sp. SMC90]UOE51329.1 LytTR family transcriptional regulator DNA-binding domain-containing protein [Mucilaginibacter sp. SMC90]
MQDVRIPYYDTKKPIAYKDTYLRLIACIVATHIVIVYGETRSTFEMLLMPAYYYAFIGSFGIAFTLFWAVRKIVIKLDERCDWLEMPLHRIGLQAFFGFIVPGLLAFLLAALYFRIRGYNILHTTYLRYDFQFILLQILLINFYYVSYYFYGRWRQAKNVIDRIGSVAPAPVASGATTFQVSKGAANVLLPIDEIAYFYRKGDSNFLRTMQGEDFFITLSLDEVQQRLPEDRFFRANRQLVLNRAACKGFDLLSYGKLKATLSPHLDGDVVISQKRALAFKTWIQEKRLLSML